jgi:acylphosphatase
MMLGVVSLLFTRNSCRVFVYSWTVWPKFASVNDKRYRLCVAGKVQGVWFRASAQHKASTLGLSGFVRNEPDGAVYLEIEGNAEALEEMIRWCRVGPPKAEVRGVDITEMPVQGGRSFEIHRNA